MVLVFQALFTNSLGDTLILGLVQMRHMRRPRRAAAIRRGVGAGRALPGPVAPRSAAGGLGVVVVVDAGTRAGAGPGWACAYSGRSWPTYASTTMTDISASARNSREPSHDLPRPTWRTTMTESSPTLASPGNLPVIRFACP